MALRGIRELIETVTEPRRCQAKLTEYNTKVISLWRRANSFRVRSKIMPSIKMRNCIWIFFASSIGYGCRRTLVTATGKDIPNRQS